MTLLVLGALVLLGFAFARILRRLGLPSVIGYLAVGIALGPSALHWVDARALPAFEPLTGFALATIFFLLGEEFDLGALRQLGARYVALTTVQSLVTMGVVGGLAMLCHAPLPLALLLGAIAGTTDPAATLAVVREQRATGPYVKTLLAVVALNGLVEMVLFSAVMPLVEIAHHGGIAWQAALGGPARELGGSFALGLALGAVLALWARTPHGRSAVKLPTVGLVLLGAGACSALHLSVLLTMGVFGAVVANAVPVRRAVMDVARGMEGPLLVLFFTLSGSHLDLHALLGTGLLGAAYVGGRLVGKLGGCSLGATLAGSPESCRRYLGCGLVPQASMAIGLAYVVQQRFPDLAGPILPLVTGAIVVFESIGPLLTRWALSRTGESAAPARGPSPRTSTGALRPAAAATRTPTGSLRPAAGGAGA